MGSRNLGVRAVGACGGGRPGLQRASIGRRTSAASLRLAYRAGTTSDILPVRSGP
jgi:hypothetical protein